MSNQPVPISDQLAAAEAHRDELAHHWLAEIETGRASADMAMAEVRPWDAIVRTLRACAEHEGEIRAVIRAGIARRRLLADPAVTAITDTFPGAEVAPVAPPHDTPAEAKA